SPNKRFRDLRKKRARLCTRDRSVRRHDDRGGVNDWLRHIYRRCGYFAPDWFAGRLTFDLGSDGIADSVGGALLRRACRDVPARRWTVHLSKRSVFPTLGILVRMDAVVGDPDGDDSGGCFGCCALSWGVVHRALADS